jgi:hypothetical protein
MTLRNVYKANRIEQIVSKIFGLKISDIKLGNRAREFCQPRQICMTLEIELCRISMPEVGKRFGQDRNTARNSQKSINDQRETDKEFNQFIDYLIFGIQNELKLYWLKPPPEKPRITSESRINPCMGELPIKTLAIKKQALKPQIKPERSKLRKEYSESMKTDHYTVEVIGPDGKKELLKYI